MDLVGGCTPRPWHPSPAAVAGLQAQGPRAAAPQLPPFPPCISSALSLCTGSWVPSSQGLPPSQESGRCRWSVCSILLEGRSDMVVAREGSRGPMTTCQCPQGWCGPHTLSKVTRVCSSRVIPTAPRLASEQPSAMPPLPHWAARSFVLTMCTCVDRCALERVYWLRHRDHRSLSPCPPLLSPLWLPQGPASAPGGE